MIDKEKCWDSKNEVLRIYMYIYILHFWESIQVLRRGVTTFWEMFGFGKELFYWPTQFWFCAPPGSGITKVWWLRGIRRCSDRLDKIRTHLRVYQLINCILKLPYCANGYVTLTWRPACPPSGRGVSVGIRAWLQSWTFWEVLVNSVRTTPPRSKPLS